MKKYNSIFVVLFVFAALFVVGLACNQSSNSTATPSTNNSSSTTTNSTSTSSTPAAPKDISGSYEATGTNEGGGSPYKASLEVTDRDEVYQFSWVSGSNKYDGVGVMTDSNVAVSFIEGENGKGCGVVLYKIGSDGSLDGKAGYWGVNQAEAEKATRTSGTGLEGEYDVSGTNTDGKAYKGKLAVKAAGAGFSFSWDGGKLNGFGIKQGDKVAVGFGKSACGFVSYDVASDGTMNGKWGSVGATTVGSETAKKK